MTNYRTMQDVAKEGNGVREISSQNNYEERIQINNSGIYH